MQKRRIDGKMMAVSDAKAKAIDRDRARRLVASDRTARNAAKTVNENVTASEQKKLLVLQSEVSRLNNRLAQYDRELTAALNRVERAHETIKVMSVLLTDFDEREATRRQLDDAIPF
ncbi:hypothetical protein LB566_03445 [Mesorhizobium sp. CA13]|uniref:hypothetical protein n=1 Tax=Mesorhizobium sp. CA13 TaxID=2876643 RepID=UPI001CCD0E60|nr:hypothetical protein [Mesorhizobium sp. CA13]MBZ9852837.1 hypothetical protein [Mesorhizobium sp. CA13]